MEQEYDCTPCSMLHAHCSTHMSKHLERDLEALEREILDQSSRVEEMIAKACQALVERRADIAERSGRQRAARSTSAK